VEEQEGRQVQEEHREDEEVRLLQNKTKSTNRKKKLLGIAYRGEVEEEVVQEQEVAEVGQVEQQHLSHPIRRLLA